MNPEKSICREFNGARFFASLCRTVDCCVASFGSGLLLCFCFSFSAHTLLQHCRTINPALVRDGFYLPSTCSTGGSPRAQRGNIGNCELFRRENQKIGFFFPSVLTSTVTASFFVATHSGTPQARLWMSTAHVKQIQNQQHTFLSCK